MNQTRKQQSLQKLKDSIACNYLRQVHLKIQEKTYSKPINPIKLSIKSSSFKNLDLATSSNSDLPLNESFQDNKSCCCTDCGFDGKKIKNLQKYYILFYTKMSVLRKQRLRKRFQNAVFCIIYLLEKWKKIRQQERAKRLFRFKTKVFENQTFFSGIQNSHSNQIIYSNPQIPNENKVNFNQQVQSIQLQIMEQKNKQRQSVKHYLQKKLNYKIESSSTLPTIADQKYQNSLSNLLFQPMRIVKTLGDEIKSSNKDHNLLNNNSSMTKSPYICQIRRQKTQEQYLSQTKSPRTATKSISSETFFPYKQNICKFRKNLVKKIKIIV